MTLKSVPNDRVQVIKAATPGPSLAIVDRGGSARAIVWPGIGSQERSMHLITLEPGGRTVELAHPSECVYHVSDGDGVMESLGDGEHHSVITGSMLFVEPNTPYRFVAGGLGAVLLGGPCPPDPSLYVFEE